MKNNKVTYNAIDSPLWFIWALQQYIQEFGDESTIWRNYGKTFKAILSAYTHGTSHSIFVQDDGLLYGSEMGTPLTWMDSVILGRPITPRYGLAVEVNALWYNAVCFIVDLAEKNNDKSFVKKWQDLPKQIGQSFIENFWNADYGYLADHIEGNRYDWKIRPNQILAAALPYSPLTPEMKNAVIETVKQNLLTPRGLRSLAPHNEGYIGYYEGNSDQRDYAAHQGSVYTWLLEHYCEAYLQLHKKSGLQHIKEILDGLEPVMKEHGLGSVSELYDGDPPFYPKGAVSQAWSVAAVLRIFDKYEKMV